MQVFQVVPGQRLSGALHPRGGRGLGRDPQRLVESVRGLGGQAGGPAQAGGPVALPQPGRQSVLDAQQAGRDQAGRVLPRLCRQRRHPVSLPRVEGQPVLGVQ